MCVYICMYACTHVCIYIHTYIYSVCVCVSLVIFRVDRNEGGFLPHVKRETGHTHRHTTRTT